MYYGNQDIKVTIHCGENLEKIKARLKSAPCFVTTPFTLYDPNNDCPFYCYGIPHIIESTYTVAGEQKYNGGLRFDGIELILEE